MENQRIQNSECFYRIFQDLADVAIFTIDVSGHITSWNRGASNIFGYDESEIVGLPLSTIFIPGDKDQAAREITEARDTGRADDERWHQRKNKEHFWASGVLS